MFGLIMPTNLVNFWLCVTKSTFCLPFFQVRQGIAEKWRKNAIFVKFCDTLVCLKNRR